MMARNLSLWGTLSLLFCSLAAAGVTVSSPGGSQERISSTPVTNVVRDTLCLASGQRIERICQLGEGNTPAAQLAKDIKLLLMSTVSNQLPKDLAAADDLHSIQNVLKGFMTPAEKRKKNKYPYFGFLPLFVGSVDVMQPTMTPLRTECVPNLTAVGELNTTTGSLSVTFANSGGDSQCEETLLLAASDSIFHLVTLKSDTQSGYTKTVHIDVSELLADPLQKWYLQNRGWSVFRFSGSLLTILADLVDTGIFLSGMKKMPLPADVFAASFDFLHQYNQADLSRFGPKFELRSGGAQVAFDLNENDVHSGDALAIMRPDGMGPLTGWHQGTTTGHSTIAIRMGESSEGGGGQLYVCESIPFEVYWPRNGVQCHKWQDWIQLAAAAEYNVVLLPLSSERRAMFNTTKAMKFYSQYEGNDYGFSTLLYSWLDTLEGNMLCLPPDYKRCLSNQLLEHLGLFLDAIVGSSATNPFRQGFNHRVNTTGKSLMETLYIAVQDLGLPIGVEHIYRIPERDEWMYNISRGGAGWGKSKNGDDTPTYVVSKSMVCCVFVCNMWKAGGMFADIDNEIQCGEQTQHDIFSMEIYDNNKFGSGRPKVCKTADPMNTQCQLMGNMTFTYHPDVNSRALYPHMGQNCTTIAPTFVRQPRC